jgi:hypothetical protein
MAKALMIKLMRNSHRVDRLRLQLSKSGRRERRSKERGNRRGGVGVTRSKPQRIAIVGVLVDGEQQSLAFRVTAAAGLFGANLSLSASERGPQSLGVELSERHEVRGAAISNPSPLESHCLALGLSNHRTPNCGTHLSTRSGHKPTQRSGMKSRWIKTLPCEEVIGTS